MSTSSIPGVPRRSSLGALSAVALLAALVGSPAHAQSAPKPENLIKWRQSAYQVMAWNSGRIKASLEGSFNKDEVVKSANAIAAIANAGLGSLFAPGTESGKGWHETTVKPALFTEGAKVAELASQFSQEASELARVAPSGDVALIKLQFGKLTRSCKACHDDFRNPN